MKTIVINDFEIVTTDKLVVVIFDCVDMAILPALPTCPARQDGCRITSGLVEFSFTGLCRKVDAVCALARQAQHGAGAWQIAWYSEVSHGS